MNELMIDLETLSTKTNATVVSIGACFFDLEKLTMGPTFYAVLDIDDQIKKGRHVDGGTLKWWIGQSEKAKRVFSEKQVLAKDALLLFNKWATANGNKLNVWSNGSSFDISIIESLYESVGLTQPWKYNRIFDVRTFMRFLGNKEFKKSSANNHNALDDALNQTEWMLRSLREKQT